MTLDQRGHDVAERLREYAAEWVGDADVAHIRRRDRRQRLATAFVLVAGLLGLMMAVALVTGSDPEVVDEPPAPTTTSSLPVLDPEMAFQGGGKVEVVLTGLIIPNDVEFDPAGHLYISETGAERVSRVEILRSGPGDVAIGEIEMMTTDIDDAEGLALAEDGALYVAGDSSVHRIAAGVETRFATGFHDPEGLAIDQNGDIYVSDGKADGSGIRITRVEVLPNGLNGPRTEVAVVPGDPADIEFGPDGRLYVANNMDAVWVVEFAEDGSASASELVALVNEAPAALAFDPAGILFVGTAYGPNVWRIAPDGSADIVLTGFRQVEGLAFDQTGSLYVVDVASDHVIRFERGTTGEISEAPQLIVEGDLTWKRTELTEPWASAILDVASLPDGGFVAAVNQGGSILWSRDGVDWTEADPTGRVAETLDVTRLSQSEWDFMAGLPDDRVAVLAGSGADVQVWLGDLAKGSWDSIPLDTEGLGLTVESIAIASNDRHVLVVADLPSGGPDSMIWLIDLPTGDVSRRQVAAVANEKEWTGGRIAAWVNDQWVITMGNTTAVSSDGETWTFGLDEGSLASYGNWVTSLTAGRTGVLATTCGGWGPHDAWFSEDGLSWLKAPGQVPGPHSGSAYSDALGFVLVDDNDGRVWQSPDGRTWSYATGVTPTDSGVRDIAVSADRLFVAGDPALLLTPR